MKLLAAGIIGASVAERYYDFDRQFDHHRQIYDHDYDRQWRENDRYSNDRSFYGPMNKSFYSDKSAVFGNTNDRHFDDYRMDNRYSSDRHFYGPMDKDSYNNQYFNNRHYDDYRKDYYSPNFYQKYSNDHYQHRRDHSYDRDQYHFDQNRFNDFKRFNDRHSYDHFDRDYDNYRHNNKYNRGDSYYNRNQYRGDSQFRNKNSQVYEEDSFHHDPEMSKLYQVAESNFWMNSGRSDNSERLLSSWNGKWDKQITKTFRECANGKTLDQDMMYFCHWRDASFFTKFAPRFISNEFNKFDSNNDKLLDKDEFKKAFAGFYANIGSSLVDIFDSDHNDVLEHSEIFDMYYNLRYLFNVDMNSFHEISSHANFDNNKNSFSKAEMSEFAVMLAHRYY